jgi:hypothetical protein
MFKDVSLSDISSLTNVWGLKFLEYAFRIKGYLEVDLFIYYLSKS